MALKPCPMCKNRPVNNTRVTFISGPCDYCGGLGVLNTESSCKCGRPAVRKFNGIETCPRYECGKAAIEATK